MAVQWPVDLLSSFGSITLRGHVFISRDESASPRSHNPLPSGVRGVSYGEWSLAVGTNAERAEIIRFWRAVEMFSAREVNRERRVYAVERGEPLPWEAGHELASHPLGAGEAWRHLVYVGVYPRESVFEVVRQRFAPDEDSFDERPAGMSALAAFVVSDEGRPLLGSEVLSSCAWAMGRLLRSGPTALDWLAGFEDAGKAFSRAFEDVVASDPEDAGAEALRQRDHEVGRRIGWEALDACLDAAVDVTETATVLAYREIRIHSLKVSKHNALKVDGHDLLNSFIAHDLAMVATQVESDSVGAALREYLRPDADLDLTGRVDVRKRLGAVLEATAPKRIPLGRWPSKPEHPLVLSQQLAVNAALEMRETGPGLLAVNGPPGTGKTTTLRDLIAGLVVERARQLAELSHPREAFAGTRQWSTENYTRTVHLWKSQLTGFEMVVASANNGAVENVTNEVPADDAIDEVWRDEAERLDYFPGIATALLNIDLDAPKEGSELGPERRKDAWALVAARLGNKRNRGRFVDAFWYRTPSRGRDAQDDADASQLPAGAQGVDQAFSGLLEILRHYERNPSPVAWEESVTEFRQVLDHAESVQADRDRVYGCLTDRPRLERELQAAQQALTSAQNDLAAARAELAEAERAEQASQAERRRRVDLRLEHRQFRPKLLEWLTTFGRAMRDWRQKDQALASEVAAAEQAMDLAHGEVTRLARAVDLGRQVVLDREEGMRHSEGEVAAVHAVLDEARTTLGPGFPDVDWGRDRTRREVGALWTDEAWNRARSELFLAALRLHKAFLQGAPTEMRQSLHAAADLVGGSAPAEVPEDAAQAAWQSLFFVVPVVSTTFASFARVFSHLGQESLGWLFIDEAGQASPQNAVGALWRSKHAVIVGDPLQLEPIANLPFRAEQAIRGGFGVDEQWLPSRSSVQRVADRVTRLGTWLPGPDGPLWVGAPLTVHRRCDEPMFGIVNDIAYDGLMIDGTGSARAEEFDNAYPSLPTSEWIDVASEASEGHWVPDEGVQLALILEALATSGFDMSQAMVIAPFRDIAERLRRYCSRYPGLVGGTVHTAQGKEADVVILVLGSDPQRPGARRWAAGKPNLLNVAVSRARRRLYVIGNHQAWATERHFDVMAERLLRRQPW